MTMNNSRKAPKAGKPYSHTQRRGDKRRQRLLQVATKLLTHMELPDLTYAAVCSAAGVPPGSARFFYPDLKALFQALLAEFTAAHDAAMARPLRARDLRNWRTVLECMIDRVAQFHRNHPVASKLTIGGHAPPDLKRIDRDNDLSRARFFRALLEEHFVVPRLEDPDRVFFLVAEIVDSAFTLSMRESGRLLPAWIEHAKVASCTFLAHHFGGELKRRSLAPARKSTRARRHA